MNSFRTARLLELAIPQRLVTALTDIAAARGRQELYSKQTPQILKALREMAMIESVESSNRIEGVTVARDRLRPLVLGRAKPVDRSEKEIAGYRRALAWIHAKARERSEEHTSELQSQSNLVCRLLLEKKNQSRYY